jgi:succinoglycan biosynthesis protein ExoM
MNGADKAGPPADLAYINVSNVQIRGNVAGVPDFPMAGCAQEDNCQMINPTAISSSTVQVCIVTFKRPKLLVTALQSVRDQQFVTQPCPKVTVLVVDNDEQQSGRDAFEKVFGCDSPTARYVVATPQGVVRARNRALEESADADFIVFLDDDEFASPMWLKELLLVQQEFDADVVTGPVIPAFENAPGWVVRGRFFDRKDHPTGAEVKFVASNNTLIRGSVARQFRFDHRFDHSLAEDTDFFMRMKNGGARMIWADEAEVYETVSQQRTTVRWLLRRAYSSANSHTRSCLHAKPGITTFASRLIRAAGGFVAGLLLLPTAVAGKDRAVRALRFIFRAGGTIAALRGHEDLHRG